MNIRVIAILAAVSIMGGCTAAAAQSGTATAQIAPATGVLTVLTNVCGAQVVVDGTHVADAVMRPSGDVSVACFSLNHTMPAGIHHVAVKAAGYKNYETTVQIVPGNQQPLLVRLMPAKGPKAAKLRQAQVWETVNPWSGTVILTVGGNGIDPRGAKIYIDGRMVGNVLAEGEQKPIVVPLGDHMLAVTCEGAKPYVSQFTATQNNPVELFVRLEPAEPAAPEVRAESTDQAEG